MYVTTNEVCTKHNKKSGNNNSDTEISNNKTSVN